MQVEVVFRWKKVRSTNVTLVSLIRYTNFTYIIFNAIDER